MASYGQTPIEDGRAAFNVYEEDDRHVEPPLQQQSEDDHSISATSSSGSQIEESPGRPTTLAKVRQASRCVRSKAKAKSKKIFHPGATHEASPQSSTAPSLAPPPSTQADDDRLYRDPPEHKGIQAKDLLRSPVSTVQSALHGASGGKMAQVVDNQAIAHGANVNLVRAHDKVASAQEGEEKQEAMDDLESLNKARQDTYVRWTMDRHVLKVRRMPPHNLSRPLKKDYMNKNDDGKGRVQWAAYSQDVRPIFTCQRAAPDFTPLPVSLMARRKAMYAWMLNEHLSLLATMPSTMLMSISMNHQSCLLQPRKLSTRVLKDS